MIRQPLTPGCSLCLQKAGSGDAAVPRKGKLPNGRVPAAAAKGKKPGVLSQSASFPARGPSGGAKKAAAAAAVATTPKQAKAAVANGSEAASGWFLFALRFDSDGVAICRVC